MEMEGEKGGEGGEGGRMRGMKPTEESLPQGERR
jgi:hypothetical protein